MPHGPNSDVDRVKALPCWNGAIDIEMLKGGLSNANYLVCDGSGKHVVRFGLDYPFHHVFRDREAMVAIAAHAAGLAPAVHFVGEGVTVTAFLEAKTFTESDMRDSAVRVGRLLKQFHSLMPRHVTGPGFMFWVFHVIRDYAQTLRKGEVHDIPELAAYLRQADAFEAAQVPLPIIFGHNDLLPGNILDDGTKLWLIDFEYAGFNTAMFDLAGAASNAQMHADEATLLLESYFGEAPGPEVKRSFAAMQCASLLRETLWAMVSKLHLNAPGVDYAAYATENRRRYENAMHDYQSVYGKLPQ
jgi:thiamine kinase-like enzyme